MCICLSKSAKIKRQSAIISLNNPSIYDVDIKNCEDRDIDLKVKLKESETDMKNADETFQSVKSILDNMSEFNDRISKFNNRSFSIYNDSILKYIYINKNNKDCKGEYISVRTLFERLADYPDSYARKEIMTNTEKQFFRKLISIAEANNLYLQTNVRLADVVGLGSFTLKDYSDKWKKDTKNEYFNVINKKHLDYVLLNRESLRVVLCIELDDPSHYDFDNANHGRVHINSHITKDIILSYCKIPFLRIDVKQAEQLTDIELLSTIKQTLRAKQVFYEYTSENLNEFNSSLKKLQQ